MDIPSFDEIALQGGKRLSLRESLEKTVGRIIPEYVKNFWERLREVAGSLDD